jgi:hypothetical protein
MEITYFHTRVEQVMVQTSLDKETMKTTIMTCANRVE